MKEQTYGSMEQNTEPKNSFTQVQQLIFDKYANAVTGREVSFVNGDEATG